MPNSLRSRLNKLVYKGLLREEDLKRIIITNPMSDKEESMLLSNVYNEGFDKGYEKAKAEYESMIDKIRAEIKDRPTRMLSSSAEYERGVNAMLHQSLVVIDKYKAESED